MRERWLLTHHARYRNPDSTRSARIFSTSVRRALGPIDCLITRRCFLFKSGPGTVISCSSNSGKNRLDNNITIITHQALYAIIEVATKFVPMVNDQPVMFNPLWEPHHLSLDCTREKCQQRTNAVRSTVSRTSVISNETD